MPAAIGFAHASGIPFGEGLVKNRYVGRTFISPSQTMRQQGIRLKLNPLARVAGKRLVVVDDSIVRGNTTRKLVALLREAGAREVHMRITSPPVKWPCFYGIDTPTKSSSSRRTSRSRRSASTSARPRSRTSRSRTWRPRRGGRPALCLACFTGDYPTRIPSRCAKPCGEPA